MDFFWRRFGISSLIVALDFGTFWFGKGTKLIRRLKVLPSGIGDAPEATTVGHRRPAKSRIYFGYTAMKMFIANLTVFERIVAVGWRLRSFFFFSKNNRFTSKVRPPNLSNALYSSFDRRNSIRNGVGWLFGFRNFSLR